MGNEISSDYLFHFTNSFENLKSIIKNGFRVCGNKESFECLTYELSLINLTNSKDEVNRIEKYREHLNPNLNMVCFCDLLLEQTEAHSKDYGNYALAFTKEWAARKDINPVFYINNTSESQPLIAQYLSMLHVMYLDNRVCNLNRHLEVLFNNIKPYEGVNFKTKEFKRFYDEREWRFIPGELNTEFNEIDGKEYLKFDLSDLIYIIVKTGKEKEELLKFLSQEQVKNLGLKIMRKDEF